MTAEEHDTRFEWRNLSLWEKLWVVPMLALLALALLCVCAVFWAPLLIGFIPRAVREWKAGKP